VRMNDEDKEEEEMPTEQELKWFAEWEEEMQAKQEKRLKELAKEKEMEAENRVELCLRDAFGKPYTVWALPEKIIREILEQIDIFDIVTLAYYVCEPWYASGVALLDISDGYLAGASVSSRPVREAHYIYLYAVPPDQDFPIDDLYDENEIRLCHEKYDGDYDKMCREENINLIARKMEALEYHAHDTIRSAAWWAEIEEQLNAIYNCKVEKI